MVERARTHGPSPSLFVSDYHLPTIPDNHFDLILILAVLTCIPDHAELAATITGLSRVLAPGGHIYLSDYPIQTNDRYRRRYAAGTSAGHPFGTFELEDGCRLTHFTDEHVAGLFAGYTRVEHELYTTTTMNGNPTTAFRSLYQLPA